MNQARTASERIIAEATSWPGVEAGPGDMGEIEFRVGAREIGHIHGDYAAHFTFPKDVRAELSRQGRVAPHPVFPNSPALAARRIRDEADVLDVIALLRLNYDRVVAHRVVSA